MSVGPSAFLAALLGAAGLLAATGGPAPAQGIGPAGSCRLALALGLDISASVDEAEYEIQRRGLVQALQDPQVREAFLTQEGAVYLLVYEWSGWQQQDVIFPWRRINGPRDLDDAASVMQEHRRPMLTLSTALGRALRFGAEQFRTLPEPCARQVIDISGDGANNQDVPPAEVRATGVLDGITVNGLAIRGADPDPAFYYLDEVIHGPGAFVMEAEGGFDDFPRAIRAKLLREVSPNMIVGAAEGAEAAAAGAPRARQ